MADGFTFQPNGALAGHVERLSDELAERLATACAADARRLAPVDTGDMVGTIRIEKPKDGVRYVVVGGQNGVDYPLYVELGTSRAPAQPFMRPALYRLRMP